MTLPISESDFTKQVEGFHLDIDAIVEGVNKCVDAFNRGGSSFLDHVMAGLMKLMSDVREGLVKLVEVVGKIVRQVAKLLSPGNPIVMDAIAGNWREVKSLITGELAAFSPSYLPAMESWEGVQGRSYRNLPDLQVGALSGLVSHAEALGASMTTHATAVVGSWIDLANLALETRRDLAKNVGAFVTGNPLKWAEVVPQIVNLIVDLLGSLENLAIQLAKYALSVYTEIQTLASASADLSGSLRGEWPKITVNTAV